MTPSLGIEPMPHCWEASALTNVTRWITKEMHYKSFWCLIFSFRLLLAGSMRTTEFVIVAIIFISTYLKSQGEKGVTERKSLQSLLTSKGATFLPLTDIGQPWCKMQSFNHTIRRRGCEEMTVVKRLCYGQCRSFYIPYRKTTFQSCSYCTPVAFTTKPVVLNCPFRSPPGQLVKSINVVTACRCRACEKKYLWTSLLQTLGGKQTTITLIVNLFYAI